MLASFAVAGCTGASTNCLMHVRGTQLPDQAWWVDLPIVRPPYRMIV